MNTTKPMIDMIAELRDRMQPGFICPDGDEYNLEDHFRELAKLFEPSDDDPLYYACGSSSIEGDHQTPVALYRLLYLLRPKSVDFSDMYKTGLFSFTSVDGRFLVSVELFKYELGLYFYAPKELIIGPGHGVLGGWPGADNGWKISDPEGIAFFEMVKEAVGRTWDVYPGNNFTV